MSLFDDRLVYPSDGKGSYTELTGVVVGVREKSDPDDRWEEVRVDVYTQEGTFSGYTPRPPKVGYMATIRIYRIGGGWYPDNEIIRWAAPTSLRGENNE